MNLNRVMASFLNSLLGIVNLVLWIIGKEPIGQMLFKTYAPEDRAQQFVFGLLTVVMYGSLILWVVNIFFWATDKESIPTQLTKLIFN